MHIYLPLDTTPLPEVFEHQSVEFVCDATPEACLTLLVDGRELEPFLRPGHTAWRWRWNPGSAVGVRELRLVIDGADPVVRHWRLRVAPAKIDQERYALLLDDVERLAAGLAFALAGLGAEGASPAVETTRRPSPAEQYFALFQEQFDAFERAARQILARPREQLRHLPQDVSLGGPETPAADALARVARGALQPAPPGVAEELQRALRPEGGVLPTTLAGARAVANADIYEHRLLKRLLELLAARARTIGALAERTALRLERGDRDGGRALRVRAIAAGCADAQRRLRELRAHPLLAGVGGLPAFRGPTPLIQRDTHYRQVYRTWLALHRSPLVTVDSPLFDIPIADLPRLYESWCALVIAHAMLALGAVHEQGIVATTRPADAPPDDVEQSIVLVEGAPLLRVQRGDVMLILRYQPRYRPEGLETRSLKPASAPLASSLQPLASLKLGSLDRHTRVPDLAIEIERPGAPLRVLVLDAKYRLEAEGGVPQDALAEAYAYLGAIGSGGTRATRGAVILYPGRRAPERYQSDVGVLPLLPGALNDLVALLATWLERDVV